MQGGGTNPKTASSFQCLENMAPNISPPTARIPHGYNVIVFLDLEPIRLQFDCHILLLFVQPHVFADMFYVPPS